MMGYTDTRGGVMLRLLSVWLTLLSVVASGGDPSSSWTVDRVRSWAREELNLPAAVAESFADSLHEEEITGEGLLRLETEELRMLGLTKLGHLKTVTAAIEGLSTGSSPSSSASENAAAAAAAADAERRRVHETLAAAEREHAESIKTLGLVGYLVNTLGVAGCLAWILAVGVCVWVFLKSAADPVPNKDDKANQ
jgi:hypothetical protein